MIYIDKSLKHATITFDGCNEEPGEILETPWRWSREGKDLPVISLRVGGSALLLSPDHVQEILPYLEHFAKTGQLVEREAT